MLMSCLCHAILGASALVLAFLGFHRDAEVPDVERSFSTPIGVVQRRGRVDILKDVLFPDHLDDICDGRQVAAVE